MFQYPPPYPSTLTFPPYSRVFLGLPVPKAAGSVRTCPRLSEMVSRCRFLSHCSIPFAFNSSTVLYTYTTHVFVNAKSLPPHFGETGCRSTQHQNRAHLLTTA